MHGQDRSIQAACARAAVAVRIRAPVPGSSGEVGAVCRGVHAVDTKGEGGGCVSEGLRGYPECEAIRAEVAKVEEGRK